MTDSVNHDALIYILCYTAPYIRRYTAIGTAYAKYL